MEKKERYNKPYLLFSGNVPNAAYLEYEWKVRKTNYIMFWDIHTLPYTPDNPNLKGRDQDPAEYDLLFDTGVTEKKLLTYGILPNRASSPVVRKDVLALLQGLFAPRISNPFPSSYEGFIKRFPIMKIMIMSY